MASSAQPFHSGHTQALYRLLLMAPNVADETLLGEHRNPFLMQNEESATWLARLETTPPRVKRLREDVRWR